MNLKLLSKYSKYFNIRSLSGNETLNLKVYNYFYNKRSLFLWYKISNFCADDKLLEHNIHKIKIESLIYNKNCDHNIYDKVREFINNDNKITNLLSLFINYEYLLTKHESNDVLIKSYKALYMKIDLNYCISIMEKLNKTQQEEFKNILLDNYYIPEEVMKEYFTTGEDNIIFDNMLLNLTKCIGRESSHFIDNLDYSDIKYMLDNKYEINWKLISKYSNLTIELIALIEDNYNSNPESYLKNKTLTYDVLQYIINNIDISKLDNLLLNYVLPCSIIDKKFIDNIIMKSNDMKGTLHRVSWNKSLTLELLDYIIISNNLDPSLLNWKNISKYMNLNISNKIIVNKIDFCDVSFKFK